MSGTVSTRWFWSDWMSDPNLRACSYAARGLWKDLLCIAGANKSEYGFVSLNGRKIEPPALARMTNGTIEEIEPLLQELENNGVCSKDRRGIIYCRRMVRAEKNRRNGRLGGNPNLLKQKENQESVQPIPKAHVPEPEPEPSRKKLRAARAALAGSPATDWPSDYVEQFWQAYPRRIGKAKMVKKLEAIKRGGRVRWTALMAAVARYAAYCVGTEDEYIKHPTTWLNSGCWEDELPKRARADARKPQRTNGWADMLRDGITEEVDGITDPRGATVIDADPIHHGPH